MTMHGQCPYTQGVFRTLVRAMSHPGQKYTLPADVHIPVDGPPALLSICRTLLDHEVSYCVIGQQCEKLNHRIFSLTKARQTNIDNADYVIVQSSFSKGQIAKAKRGKPAYPDTAATIIYLLNDEIRTARGTEITFRGPGIEHPLKPDMEAVDTRELKLIQKCNADYPLGIDCIFVQPNNQIMCLPRTTQIEVK